MCITSSNTYFAIFAAIKNNTTLYDANPDG